MKERENETKKKLLRREDKKRIGFKEIEDDYWHSI